jgi:hypothetical protein
MNLVQSHTAHQSGVFTATEAYGSNFVNSGRNREQARDDIIEQAGKKSEGNSRRD